MSLEPHQIKTVLDRLFNGVDTQDVYWLHQRLALLNQYKESEFYFLWLVRQQVTGQKLVDFFHERVTVPDAANFIHSRRFGTKHSVERLKVDALI